MKVVVIGNMGYVGPVLVQHLRNRFPQAELIGYDSGWFGHCLTTIRVLPECLLNRQIFGDVRELPQDLLEGADAVVQLAAVSNDPMGSRFEEHTDDINFRSSVDIAQKAAASGVGNFVFASSCSVYGSAEGGPRKESDPLNPLTAYARSKINTEKMLERQDLGSMTVTCLRFATACGMSDRLRLDLVLNDFVACALATGIITVLSDGTPWRPLIDVHDMARAIEWALTRNQANGGQFLTVNTGSAQWNYQVKDLAAAVVAEMPSSSFSINTQALPDKRSYQVDFGLFRQLAPEYQPIKTLQDSVRDLRDGLSAIGFADADFRNSDRIRLKVLDRHMQEGRMTSDLRWIG